MKLRGHHTYYCHAAAAATYTGGILSSPHRADWPPAYATATLFSPLPVAAAIATCAIRYNITRLSPPARTFASHTHTPHIDTPRYITLTHIRQGQRQLAIEGHTPDIPHTATHINR